MEKIPIWEKATLTLEEAASYTGIGINKLRELSNSAECNFVLWNGSKRLLKRKKLEEYLNRAYSMKVNGQTDIICIVGLPEMGRDIV